jgi:hypothetical protein
MAIIHVQYADEKEEWHDVKLSLYQLAGLEKLRDGRLNISHDPGPEVHTCVTVANGSWLLLSAIQNKITVNGDLVVGLRVLSHDDVINFDGLQLHFLAEVPEALAADSLEVIQRMRCPYSRARFQAGDQIVRCPLCGLPHLLEAWVELTQCARLHCGYTIHVNNFTGADEISND